LSTADVRPGTTGEDSEDADFTPEDAFGLPGNELRADVLRVLGESPYEGFSFSELRERVDEGVDSGQFNYHLRKLVGPFVENTGDGYGLRTPGRGPYRAIGAGAFSRSVSLEPFEAGFDCYFCATPVEAAYDEGSFRLTCPGCDHLFASTTLPPSAVEGADEAELLDRVDQYDRHQMLAASLGVCPVCVNGMEPDTAGCNYLEPWCRETAPIEWLLSSTTNRFSRNYSRQYQERALGTPPRREQRGVDAGVPEGLDGPLDGDRLDAVAALSAMQRLEDVRTAELRRRVLRPRVHHGDIVERHGGPSTPSRIAPGPERHQFYIMVNATG